MVTDMDNGHMGAARLRLERTRAGLTARQVAELAGVDVLAYQDMETHASELECNVSLGEIRSVCHALGISADVLFDLQSSRNRERISLPTMVDRMLTYTRDQAMNWSEFEAKVGYTVSASLSQPDNVLEWNVDCLRSVCSEIGCDWLAVIASLTAAAEGSDNRTI
jgi:transcriptional regulator with XRE-family HTH domain